MGNSISLNVLCCRKHHLIKVKIDTQSESDVELDTNVNYKNCKRTKRKERISSRTENMFGDLMANVSSKKDKQTRVKATRFQIKIPAQICKRRKNSNENSNVEIKSERIEYLQEMESDQLKVQNQINNANKSGHHSNINLSINTTTSRTQFRSHDYYTNKYGSNSKNESRNSKYSIRNNIKSTERSHDKKFSQGQLSQKKQNKFNQVTQDSQSKESDKFFEESITSEPNLTESIERPKIFVNKIDNESVNNMSPLRIRNLAPFLDKSQDSFNHRLSSNIEDSIAFDSASQSVCTDLEALNQLADQLKPSSTQIKDDCSKKPCEPQINIFINSISSENLFSPDNKLMITTSQESQESHLNLPINRRTQRAMKKLENQRDHAIQYFHDQQNQTRKNIQEKIKQQNSLTIPQKEKSITKINKSYKDKLLILEFDHDQILINIQSEYKLKKIFTNETVHIRKACQQIQDLTFVQNKNQEEQTKMLENLTNLYQILLKSARKHLLYFLEASIIQSLFVLSIQITKIEKLQQLDQKTSLSQKQAKSIEPITFKLLELIFKSILQIATCHKAGLYYLLEMKKNCVEVIDTFLWCLNNNCDQDLQLSLIQLASKILQKSLTSYTTSDMDLAMYLITHPLMLKLNSKITQLKDKNLVEHSLFVIKYQNLVGILLKCLYQSRNIKPVYEINDVQKIIINTNIFSQNHIIKELSTVTTNQQSILSILEQAANIFIMCLQIQPVLSQEIFSQEYQLIKKVYNRISDESSEQDLGLVFDTLMSIGNPEFIKEQLTNQMLDEVISKALYCQDAVLFLVVILISDQDKQGLIDQNSKEAILNYLNQSLLLYEDFKSPIMIEDSLMIHYHNPLHQPSQYASATNLLLLSPQHAKLQNQHKHNTRPRFFLQNEMKLDQDCLVLDTQRSHQPFEYQVFPQPPLSTRSLYSQQSYNSSSQQSQTSYNQQNQWVQELNIKDLISLNIVQELISIISRPDINKKQSNVVDKDNQ